MAVDNKFSSPESLKLYLKRLRPYIVGVAKVNRNH